MTLKELIDISEVPLVISEGDYRYPFITLQELDCYSSDEFSDVLSEDMLNRKIKTIKAKDSLIYVCLWEVER